MPVLFIYLLKVNIALLLFYAAYFLLLRQLTFYGLNRIYLVAAMLFATVYPQINFPGFAKYYQALRRPFQLVIHELQIPTGNFFKPMERPVYWQWMEIAFWTGAALLAVRLFIRLYSLYKLYRNSIAAEIYGHKIRLMNGEAGPFSFWKSIYVNPANHKPADLKAILLHEQVHVNDWHSLDILLAELGTVFYWFNPGVWLMRRAVRENIEFITDRKTLNRGMDPVEYQFSLINSSCTVPSNVIVSHFNLSTIKKRIAMMNTESSPKRKLLRYLLLVPVVIMLLFVLNTTAGMNNRAMMVQKMSGTAPKGNYKHPICCKKNNARTLQKSDNKHPGR
jgi:bla regulator protein blaR1